MTHQEIKERNRLIRIDFENGLDRNEIKQKYNVESINYAIRGLYRKRTEFHSKINKDELISLHNEGLNHIQIGEKLGLAHRYIVTKIKQYGLTPYKIKRGRKVGGIRTKAPYIREKLPPRLEALREKYRNLEKVCETGDGAGVGVLDFEYNAMPKKWN